MTADPLLNTTSIGLPSFLCGSSMELNTIAARESYQLKLIDINTVVINHTNFVVIEIERNYWSQCEIELVPSRKNKKSS